MLSGAKRRGLVMRALAFLAVPLPYFTSAAPRGDGRPDIIAFSTPFWHYVEWHGPHLYDLRSDPLEMHNVASRNPALMIG